MGNTYNIPGLEFYYALARYVSAVTRRAEMMKRGWKANFYKLLSYLLVWADGFKKLSWLFKVSYFIMKSDKQGVIRKAQKRLLRS